MREHKEDRMRKNDVMSLLLLTMALLIIFPANGLAADPPGIPDGWTNRFVYANGIRLHYYHAVPATDKPVIVMVHGVTDNGLCWATLAFELQDDYDIYMLDTRGHGLSDPFTTSDDGETLVKDVVEFIRAMNIENPILMGHSMGAATVMRVGAEYPDLAQAVIMLDPFISRPVGNRSDRAPQTPPKKSKEGDKAEDEVTEISVAMFGEPEVLVKQNNYAFDDLVEKGKRDNPKWDIADIKYWALSKKQYHGPYSQEAWEAMRGTMMTGNALSKIQVPSLVLKADTSPEGRKANEEAIEGLDGVTLIHMDDAAHNLHHDDLDRTVKEITVFLSSALK